MTAKRIIFDSPRRNAYEAQGIGPSYLTMAYIASSERHAAYMDHPTTMGDEAKRLAARDESAFRVRLHLWRQMDRDTR